MALTPASPPDVVHLEPAGGCVRGQDVSLECHSEAYPTSINYWTTERGDMIVSGDKYEAVSMDNGYNKYMMLKIRSVKSSDFGSYKCVAKNSLGETDGVIKLDEIPAPTTVSTSTVAFVTLPTTTRKKDIKSRIIMSIPQNVHGIMSTLKMSMLNRPESKCP
ncbi:hypothetical protein ANN_15484 [Periplaneta americana]|uniref:Ig-like domain-containing protein n=1 Tax=Periplaneta americana TaxID=6978 RepID=A0ABQ8SGI3_PERAM|nr:hypothetical protein ANN_15484 [Periplaneta americana]